MVGSHTSLVEFLDRGRSGMASSFLTRAAVGATVVDAKAVARLYRNRVRGWLVLTLVLLGLAAVVAAIATTPVGQDWWQRHPGLLGRRVHLGQGAVLVTTLRRLIFPAVRHLHRPGCRHRTGHRPAARWLRRRRRRLERATPPHWRTGSRAEAGPAVRRGCRGEELPGTWSAVRLGQRAVTVVVLPRRCRRTGRLQLQDAIAAGRRNRGRARSTIAADYMDPAKKTYVDTVADQSLESADDLQSLAGAETYEQIGALVARAYVGHCGRSDLR